MNFKQISFKKFLRICINRKDPNHQDAWREFDRRYRQVILSKVLAVTKNRVHVEDITGRVLMRLILHDFRALRNFRGENEITFISYLGKISRYTAIAHMMKNKLRKEDELDLKPLEYQKGEDPEVLHRYLVDMSRSVQTDTKKSTYNQERDVLIFVLRKLSGFKAKDVAEIPMLNVTAGNVDNIINRLTQLIDAKIDDFLMAA